MSLFLPRGGCAQSENWLEHLLLSRGLDTEAKKQAFLHPDFTALPPAALLPSAADAVRVLKELREKNATVAVYGDYDVDGVCASVIMEETLRAYGIPCFVYVPDRHEEGYGLNKNAVEALSSRCQGILTVDCGIVSHEEVRLAGELGMTVIVTDHHRPGDTLPPADAVVCPLLEDYAFPYLCGAGVAWKICDLLMGRAFAMERLDLCALATVADMVPLTGENRLLVHEGLKRMALSRRPGIQALCKRAGTEQMKVKASVIAYQLAPRLNAAGRLESAMDAVNLLRTWDMDEAEALSLKLDMINTRRKEAQSLVMAEAEDAVKTMDLTASAAIVVLGEDWDSGVVGLAAGKIAEKYGYPTVILTRLEDGVHCVGSARSGGAVDIHRALKECGDIFVRFGGHAAAAGMTLKCDDVPLLCERLSRNVRSQLMGAAPMKVVRYDASMRLSDITVETVEMMERLEPFGMGNPAPQFLFEKVEMQEMRQVGARGAHLKCVFRQGNEVRSGIAFGMGAFARLGMHVMDVVAAPTVNSFMGRVTAECQVTDMHIVPSCLSADPERELRAVLQELRRLAENIYEFAPAAGFSVVEEVPSPWMEMAQGTLLWCRRSETAVKMAMRYPRLPLLTDPVGDARGYTGIACADTEFAPCYRRVVLCDGLICPEEAMYLRARYPDTEFVCLQGTGARDLAKQLHVPIDELRALYKQLRERGSAETALFAERIQWPCARVEAAFDILADMGLAKHVQAPRGIMLLPPVKSDPMTSGLYRLLDSVSQ